MKHILLIESYKSSHTIDFYNYITTSCDFKVTLCCYNYKDLKNELNNCTSYDCLIVCGDAPPHPSPSPPPHDDDDDDGIEDDDNMSSSFEYEELSKIFKMFTDKPILCCEYGCVLLGKYYRCETCKCEIYRNQTKHHLIIDNRFKINKNIIKSNNLIVTFNTKKNIEIPDDSSVDIITFSAKSPFEPCGYKFTRNHYGFIFTIINSDYGQTILNNFLHHI